MIGATFGMVHQGQTYPIQGGENCRQVKSYLLVFSLRSPCFFPLLSVQTFALFGLETEIAWNVELTFPLLSTIIDSEMAGHSRDGQRQVGPR